MPDRRLAQRFSRRVKVQFWRRGAPAETFPGYTTNLSHLGAFIETNRPVGTGARLQVEFATEHGGFLMEARVARSIRTPVDLRSVRPSGMGIQFVPVKELLAEIVPLSGHVSYAKSRTASDYPQQSQAASRGSQPSDKDSSQPAGRSKPGASAQPATEPRRSTESDPSEADIGEHGIERQVINPARFHPAASPLQKHRETRTEPHEQSAGEQKDDEDAKRGSAAQEKPPGASSTAESAFDTGQPGAGTTFTIRFTDVERLRQVWKSELQYGGIFLPTDNPLPIDSKIELVFFLPSVDQSYRLGARVVLVNQPGSKESPNLLVGMGTRLSSPEPLFREIRALLQQESD